MSKLNRIGLTFLVYALIIGQVPQVANSYGLLSEVAPFNIVNPLVRLFGMIGGFLLVIG